MAELFTGAYKSLRPKSNTNKLGEVIRELEIETIDINSSIIEDYAKTRAALEKSGVRIDNFDLLIAATATTYKLPLLTNNTKHFNHIPFLKLI